MVVRKYTKNNSFYRKNYNFVEPGFVPITATGGTITSAGPYMIHTFTSNGTFTITQGSYQEIDYFTIAGGGAAGRSTVSGGDACGGGAGGALMNWIGLKETDVYPYQWSQCIGPKLYTQSGDVWTVNVGLGGTARDDNSGQNSGGDGWLLKNGAETLRVYGGGAGGGGTGKHVGTNGGCSGGTAGVTGNGTNLFSAFPGQHISNNEVQWAWHYGKSTWPYKQGNGNYIMNVTAANQRSNGAPGIYSPAIYYWAGYVGTDTVRSINLTFNIYPGYGIRTTFAGTFAEYGHGGCSGTTYSATAEAPPATPSFAGSGGHGRTAATSGISGSGSNGVTIFRYLTNQTVAAANVELLIVGGGGGGGSIAADAGGGGGSVIYYGNDTGNTGGPLILYNGTYGVTVGGGGVLSTSATVSNLGGHSYVTGIPCDNVTNYGMPKANTFGGFYAYGGGSKYLPRQELYGSGHGVRAGRAAMEFGLPHPNHGYRGGTQGFAGTPSVSAGGGGAGGVGGDAVNLTSAGNGGIGKAFTISGTSTYYGGGGGGGRSTTGGTTSTGGLGGGANGYNGTATTVGSGTVNTGGGGGGGFSATTGGAGGSGIVIIRYPNSYPAANGTTGSPTVANTGGWRTYTFTQSGSISFG